MDEWLRDGEDHDARVRRLKQAYIAIRDLEPGFADHIKDADIYVASESPIGEYREHVPVELIEAFPVAASTVVAALSKFIAGNVSAKDIEVWSFTMLASDVFPYVCEDEEEEEVMESVIQWLDSPGFLGPVITRGVASYYIECLQNKRLPQWSDAVAAGKKDVGGE